MGMVMVFAGGAAFVVTMVLGIVCLAIHARVRSKKGSGSWSLYAAIAVGVCLGLIAVGWWTLPEAHSGAPTEDDFNRIFRSFVMWGSAPGVGLMAGLLALLHTPEPLRKEAS
ncbi:MAG: hypothetical protein AAF560_24650 [Acidobacteriota bacterium]